MNEYSPSRVSHPRETLGELLQECSHSPEKYAGLPIDDIAHVMRGGSISLDLMDYMEREFDIPARFWENLEEQRQQSILNEIWNHGRSKQAIDFEIDQLIADGIIQSVGDHYQLTDKGKSLLAVSKL